jgi:hypothetical protein
MSCVEVCPNACECVEMFLEGKCVHTTRKEFTKNELK